MLQVTQDDLGVHEVFLLDVKLVSVFYPRDSRAHDPWVGDMQMPEKTCTHGTFFVLEYSVAVFSPGHGGQVSVSVFPRSQSVVLPPEYVIALCI